MCYMSVSGGHTSGDSTLHCWETLQTAEYMRQKQNDQNLKPSW